MSASPPPVRLLAYGFWHWKQDDIPTATYEERQIAFQAALAADPPAGFLRGTTVRLAGAGWAAGGASAYEDWYVVRDMASLERLNEAAVTGTRQAPHDAVARLAAGGTAGLYDLRLGAPTSVAGHAAWFGKPEGMTYSRVFEELTPIVQSAAAALWCRRMVLGPTPELCLQSPQPVELPAVFVVQRFPLETVWSGPI